MNASSRKESHELGGGGGGRDTFAPSLQVRAEEKNTGTFFKQKEWAWQISADSEKPEKSARNPYIRLSCTTNRYMQLPDITLVRCFSPLVLIHLETCEERPVIIYLGYHTIWCFASVWAVIIATVDNLWSPVRPLASPGHATLGPTSWWAHSLAAEARAADRDISKRWRDCWPLVGPPLLGVTPREFEVSLSMQTRKRNRLN